MNQNINKNLLYSHFRGHTSARERRMIDEWARQPGNEEVFYKYLMEWELSQPHLPVDAGKSIARCRERIANLYDVEDVRPVVRRKRGRIWMAAACALTALGTLFIFHDRIRYRQLSTAAGEVRSWTLDDGSSVNLKANSVLTLPRFGFGSSAREVTLTGEADFDVRHLPGNLRFVVKAANQVDVVVLGTRFSVYSRTEKTQIRLNRGRVRVVQNSRGDRKTILMTPGDQVVVDKASIRTGRFDPLNTARNESRFVFRETSLAEVARLLRTNYELQVRIEQPELEQVTVSGSFNAESYQELIQSISKILGIRYSIKGKQVTFSEGQ